MKSNLRSANQPATGPSLLKHDHFFCRIFPEPASTSSITPYPALQLSGMLALQLMILLCLVS